MLSAGWVNKPPKKIIGELFGALSGKMQTIPGQEVTMDALSTIE